MMAEQNGEHFEICGLDGEQDEFITRHEFNYFVRKVKIFHMIPLQTKVTEMHSALFDPAFGLVTIRRFIFLIAAGAVTITTGIMAGLAFLHTMGWWL